MKRALLLIIVYAFCWRTAAQVGKESLSAYSDNVNNYEQAVTDIVRDHKYEEGISALTTLIERSEKVIGYPQNELASYYRTRGHGWFRLKQYQQAAEDMTKALTLLQEAGERGKAELNITWYQLANVYYYWGKSDETMHAADNAVKTAIDYYGSFHSETMDAYSMRSNIAGFYNKKEKALQDRLEIFKIIQHIIQQNFVYLTASERSAYWNKYAPETTHMFTFAHKMEDWQSEFTDALFNQQLLAKGLLLTAESSLQRAIDGDSKLKEEYLKIRQLRVKASDKRTSPKEAQEATLEADRRERALGSSAGSLYQFMDFLKVSVSDVCAKLKPTDIAVEFVDYRIGKDSVMYAALVLSPRWQHVRFLPLIEAHEISQHSANLIEKIWMPILEVAGSGVKEIYFSPSGLLYQIPIESHLLADGRSMGEAYHMHRLSSTRWLVLNNRVDEGKDAVIYGGLNYDTSISDMQKDAQRYPNTRQTKNAVHKMRGAMRELEYLPWTKVEAEAIAQIINARATKGLHADLLLGKDGTEASFKNLDGQNKQIVHVATHGFYDSGGDLSADVLSRCGLYFAGADNVLQGETIPIQTDDGILTALEISALDLRGLDLVTLSACQTGDGEITGDGVFGLQRGFKKAGANTILMSLWKVDDEATGLLMAEFYKNWVSKGKTKYEALELAKRTVRLHKEKGWNDPKYWAAFILLDAF